MPPYKLLVYLSRILLVAGAIVVLFAASCAEADQSDSDKVLLANFAAHEAEFNRLAEMCHQDLHMTRITYNMLQTEATNVWPRPQAEWGITPDRWQAYNDLMSELKINNGLIQFAPTTIWFVVSGSGMAESGSGKGYAYLSESPKAIQQSLDKYVFKDPALEGHFAYRPIKDNWYLFVAKY